MSGSTSSIVTRADRGQAARPRVVEETAGQAQDQDSRRADLSPHDDRPIGPISPLRKAAIVLISLEQSLASHVMAHLDRAAVEAVTWEIARLDRIDPAVQLTVLEEFLGLGLRRLCFVFEDLLKMEEHHIREVYREADIEGWALALAGAAPPVRAKVLGALRLSVSGELRRHLDGLGPFRLSDTEVAQAEIAERIRLLYDQGVIDLPDPGGREEVLV